jgi:hypothetical protein
MVATEPSDFVYSRDPTDESSPVCSQSSSAETSRPNAGSVLADSAAPSSNVRSWDAAAAAVSAGDGDDDDGDDDGDDDDRGAERTASDALSPDPAHADIVPTASTTAAPMIVILVVLDM